MLAVASLAPLPIWWLHLFSHTDVVPAAKMLAYTFSSENAHLWWYIGWAVLPIVLLLMVAFYCSRLAMRRRWSIAVAAALLVTAIVSIFHYPIVWPSLVFTFALSVWWTWGLGKSRE